MADPDDDVSDTLTPITLVNDDGVGLAVREHEGHACLQRYRIPEEGKPLGDEPVFARGEGSSFVRVDLAGTRSASRASTPAYRNGWERTFGKNGGIS
jgi:hypothetical protein